MLHICLLNNCVCNPQSTFFTKQRKYSSRNKKLIKLNNDKWNSLVRTKLKHNAMLSFCVSHYTIFQPATPSLFDLIWFSFGFYSKHHNQKHFGKVL